MISCDAGELINGDSGSQDFGQADMFSLGASLYEMCSGEPLSTGSQEDSSQWPDIRRGVFFRNKRNLSKPPREVGSSQGESAGVEEKVEVEVDGEGAVSSVNPVWRHYPEDVLRALQQLMAADPTSRPAASQMVALAAAKLQAIKSKRREEVAASCAPLERMAAGDTAEGSAQIDQLEISNLREEIKALKQQLGQRNSST